MTDTMQPPTTVELAAALTRLLKAHFAERGGMPKADGRAFDRLRSGMFFVLYMASAPLPDGVDEHLVHDVQAAAPYTVFCEAANVTDAAWHEAMDQPQTCDVVETND